MFKSVLGHSDLLVKDGSIPNCPSLENNNNFVNINSEISSVSWTKDKVEVCTRGKEFKIVMSIANLWLQVFFACRYSGVPVSEWCPASTLRNWNETKADWHNKSISVVDRSICKIYYEAGTRT